MCGGFVIAQLFLGLTPKLYWTSVWQALLWPNDVIQGLLKPLIFAVAISMVGCFFGLRTSGGTQGVGRATTQAVVGATVLIFILDLMLTKIFVSQSGG
jgi:phospholipid/cholesterol/gamma-HCH transport system permease protein